MTVPGSTVALSATVLFNDCHARFRTKSQILLVGPCRSVSVDLGRAWSLGVEKFLTALEASVLGADKFD